MSTLSADDEVSVVIGTYNRCGSLKGAIESIFRETKTRFCICVTDAGSTDETADYLKSIASDQVKPTFVGRKLGQAAAYNAIFRSLKSRFVCWLSDDNEVVNRGIDVAVSILRQDPQIGLVGLKVRDVLGPFVKAPYIGGMSVAGILNVNQGVLPTSVLQSLGGFCETFRDYGIDPDLTARVLFSGKKVVLTKRITLLHHRSWTEDKDSVEYQVLRYKHARTLALYKERYAGVGIPTHSRTLKPLIWKMLSCCIRRTRSSRSAILDRLLRDYENMLTGCYISLLDPLKTRSKSYHLVQKCPRRYLPKPEWVKQVVCQSITDQIEV